MSKFEIQPYEINHEILSIIDKADTTVKRDFYYRYSIQLIKEEKYSEA